MSYLQVVAEAELFERISAGDIVDLTRAATDAPTTGMT